ncbi:hypothetical protein MYX06_03745 [Patescibacteria group bacterium AH-259-L05]|nr:hypothetical protein [Patescibacteria group bacterium AH-259-L05]
MSEGIVPLKTEREKAKLEKIEKFKKLFQLFENHTAKISYRRKEVQADSRIRFAAANVSHTGTIKGIDKDMSYCGLILVRIPNFLDVTASQSKSSEGSQGVIVKIPLDTIAEITIFPQ